MPRIFIAACIGLLIACVIGFGIRFGLATAGAEPLSAGWVIAAMIGTFSALGVMKADGRRAAPKADAATRQAALSERPAPGMARIVVFREGRMGGRNGIDLSLDGKTVVQLISPQFTALDLAPGRHALRAALAATANAGSVPGAAEIDLLAGEVAIMRITLAMRLTTSNVVLSQVKNSAAALDQLARAPMVMAMPEPV